MFAKKFLLPVVGIALGAAAWAQAPDDGPDRGVARISILNGDVSVRRSDSGDHVAAALNAPLVVQDRVITGINSRSELQFDSANFLRLGANSEVRLAELEYRRYLVQIARGTVTWRVLRDQEAYVEISTPSVSVRPVKRGTYRVTVSEDGSSEVTVRSGEAEVFTPRGSERLRSGRTMLARGGQNDPEFRMTPEIPDDEWDRWNEMRDRDLEHSNSYRYMSRDIYGAEDLDSHGRWVSVPSYGWVWSPRVAAGWAPYRYGRWSWVDWYGWTWVSHDPWGWAPYHYGRWFYQPSHGWCWWPGGIGVRHRWAPAFVAFFGFGGVGVGTGWGRVGWVPLAPWEPYHAWWGPRHYGGWRNRGYFDNSVTLVNNVNITNVYRNARIHNGISAIDGDGFRRGRIADSIHVNDGSLRQASLARGPLPMSPERESLRLADRDPRVHAVDNGRQERFFSNRRPALVEKISFDEQRRGMEQIARRSFDDPTRVTGETTVRRPETRTAGESPTDEQRGWRRADETQRGAPETRTGFNVEGTRPADNEWRRFGSARVGEGTEARGAERSGRFGDPVAPRAEAPRTDLERAPSAEGWRRFGDSTARGEAAESSRSDRATQRSERSETFRGGREAFNSGASPADSSRWGDRSQRIEGSGRSAGREERSMNWGDRSGREAAAPPVERRGDSNAGRSSESIRISPPIVRERADFGRGGGSEGPRSAPSGSGGGDAGGGRGGDGGGRSGDAGGGRSGGGGRGR